MEKTLEQILADFDTTKANVASIKSRIEEKNKAMTDNNIASRLDSVISSIKNCNQMINNINLALSNPMVSETEKKELNVKKAEWEKALEMANKTLTELKELQIQYNPSYNDMINLQQAEQQKQETIKLFMGDPQINDYLSKQFQFEYKQKIESYENSIRKTSQKYNDLASLLTSDEFKPECDSLKSAYNVVKLTRATTPGVVAARDSASAYTTYARAIEDLKNKLQSKGIDIVLFQDPDDLRQSIEENDRQLAETTASLTEIDNNKTRLDDLVRKATLPEDLPEVKEYKDALTEYKGIFEKLKNAGYIDENVVTRLKNPGSDVSKSYETYKTANKAVREAMLAYQAEPSDENKTKLKEKIAEYDTISTKLEAESEMKRDAWNRYYLEQIVSIAKENETDIDPIFLDDTAINRIQQIEKEKFGASKKTEPLKTSINELMEDQKHILDGKDATNFENHLTNYSTNYNGLATALKIEPAQLASIIKAAAMKKISKIGNFFRKINIFKGKKEETKDTPKIEYLASVTDEDKAKAKACYDRFKRANDAKTNKEKPLLTDDERNELNTLKAQAASKSELEAKKLQLEQDKSRLEAARSALPTVATGSKIKDAEDIIFVSGKGDIIGAVRKELENMDREDR